MRALYIKLLTMKPRTKRKREEGATMVEYGIMIALIAAVAITIVQLLGVEIREAFNEVLEAIQKPEGGEGDGGGGELGA